MLTKTRLRSGFSSVPPSSDVEAVLVFQGWHTECTQGGSLNRTAPPLSPGGWVPDPRVGAGSPEASPQGLTAIPQGVCVPTSSPKEDTCHIGEGHPTDLILT